MVHQLVAGQRTFELARTTTGDDGAWTVTHDGYEAVAIEVIGGAAAEAAGGAVALDGGTVLDAVALELAIGEVRTGVVVSPVTHLVAKLGRARWLAGKEATFDLAVAKAQERVAAHLGFDPIRTPVSAVSAAAGSPTDSVKYGLVLAGLSELAALAAADQGVTVQSVNTVELTKVLARDAGSAEALFDGNGAEPLYVSPAALPGGRGFGRRPPAFDAGSLALARLGPHGEWMPFVPCDLRPWARDRAQAGSRSTATVRAAGGSSGAPSAPMSRTGGSAPTGPVMRRTPRWKVSHDHAHDRITARRLRKPMT